MKNIVITIALLVTLNSCTKSVLDKLPLDNITENQVWNDPALINAYLIQAYTQTTVWESELSYQPHMSAGDKHFHPFLIHSVSDESRFNRTWAGNANAFKSAGIRINGGLLEWWETPYKIIRNLNLFIEKLPGSPIDEETKKLRLAEARFIRAYNYFAMVVRYGGVPLVLNVQQTSDPDSTLYPKRNSEKELYDFVLEEMHAIAAELPEAWGENDYGRPSKYAALALKSRAALYAGSIAKYGMVQLNGLLGIPSDQSNNYFQQSLNASKQIMDSQVFALYNKESDKITNFRNIFLDKKNIETIFVRRHDGNDRSTGGNGWQYDFFQCPVPSGWGGGNQNGVYLEMVEEFEYADGRPGKLDYNLIQQGVWKTEDLWADRDPRFYATLYTQNTPWQGIKLDFHMGIVKPDGTITTESYEGVPANGLNKYTGFGVLKYLDEAKSNMDAATAYASKTDWIVFRYAEILLNYAEAAFELGDNINALNAINNIRERAGIALRNTVSMENIRHERKIELAFEGHRYWDLRRWRIAEDVLTKNRSGLRYVLDYNTRNFKLQIIPKMDGANSNPIFYSYNYYFPITIARTSENNNLLENPGYN